MAEIIEWVECYINGEERNVEKKVRDVKKAFDWEFLWIYVLEGTIKK